MFASSFVIWILGIATGIMLWEGCIIPIMNHIDNRKFVKLRKRRIGTRQYNVTLFTMEQPPASAEMPYCHPSVFYQIEIFKATVEDVVSTISVYHLEQYYHTAPKMQKIIDQFVANVESFNDYLKMPDYVITNTIEKAAKEVVDKNQPLLDRVEDLRRKIDEEVAQTNQQLVYFKDLP